MYQVYTIKNQAELSKTLVKRTKDYEEALEIAEKAIENHPELQYVVEETVGRFDIYGELEVNVVAES